MTERRKTPLRLRRQVAMRAQYRCKYCKAPEAFSLDTFTIDHIQPISAGGSDELDNLAFACYNCNRTRNHASPPTEQGGRDKCTSRFAGSGRGTSSQIDVNILTIEANAPESGMTEFKASTVPIEKTHGGLGLHPKIT